MKKQGIWKKCMPMVLAAQLLLGGCSLLPSEETGGHLVLVQTVDSVQYQLAEVTRDDVELIKDLYCTYQQTSEESLSFGTSNRAVRYVYVEVGENVKKGDLLAELELDDLEEDIRQVNYEMEKNTLLLSQLQERKEFDLDEIRRQYDGGGMTAEQYSARAAKNESDYESAAAEYEDALYILEMRLEKLEKELEGCRIYAGMDGMVTMVRSGMLDRSKEPPKAGMEVIRIIDKSHCIFCLTDLEYAEYFIPGEEMELTNNNGTVYRTRVMTQEEAPDTQNIYFSLIDTDATLTVGTRAYARLILESRQDVLTLPPAVVHHADDTTYVYCEDEDGLKSVRYITTGLVGSKLVEIVDGLEEGEMVIRR